MNRRSFLKGIVASTAGALVVPDLILPEQSERRFWQLDSTMTRSSLDAATLRFSMALEPYSTPVFTTLPRISNWAGVDGTITWGTWGTE